MLPLPYQLSPAFRSDIPKIEEQLNHSLELVRNSYEELTNGTFLQISDGIIQDALLDGTNVDTLRRQRDIYYAQKLQETLVLLEALEMARKQLDQVILFNNN